MVESWFLDLLVVGIIALIMFLTVRKEYNDLRQENQKLRKLVKLQHVSLLEQNESWREAWI